jgi:RNA recognition motif-containing protein
MNTFEFRRTWREGTQLGDETKKPKLSITYVLTYNPALDWLIDYDLNGYLLWFEGEMARGTGKGKSEEAKKKQEKSFTIFVGQIPFDAKEEEVKKLFETAGKASSSGYC